MLSEIRNHNDDLDSLEIEGDEPALDVEDDFELAIKSQLAGSEREPSESRGLDFEDFEPAVESISADRE